MKDYMHLECRILQRDVPEETAGLTPKSREIPEEKWMGVEEIDEILARTYHANKRNKEQPRKDGWNRKLTRPSTPPPGDPVYKGTGKGAVREKISAR